MATQDTFQCSIVTPEKEVLDRPASFVAFPAHDGQVGILRGRAPLLCRLGIGPLRVEGPDGDVVLFIDGGFAQMVDNRLTILTEQAKDPAQLDRAEAQRLLEEAKVMVSHGDRDFVERQKALERARNMIRMAPAGD